MDYEVRVFAPVPGEKLEIYFIAHFGDEEQAAWEYAESWAKEGIYAEVHTQSTHEGCTLDRIKEER